MFTELGELVVLGRFAGGPAVTLPTLTELRFLQFPIGGGGGRHKGGGGELALPFIPLC